MRLLKLHKRLHKIIIFDLSHIPPNYVMLSQQISRLRKIFLLKHMVLVQFIKYLIEPQLSELSAYSIENREWIMVFIFIVWVLSYTYLLISSIHLKMNWLQPRISLSILLISSIGLIIAAMLNMESSVSFKSQIRQTIHKPIKSSSNEKYIRCP